MLIADGLFRKPGPIVAIAELDLADHVSALPQVRLSTLSLRCSLASIGRLLWPPRGAPFKCELRRWLTRHVGLKQPR